MALWQPFANLRDYVSQNPPVLTFFLGLLALAVSFISLSAYCHTHTLPNPDTTKDWNHLLSALSQFHLCVKANLSSDEPVSPGPSALTGEEPGRQTSANSSRIPPVTSLRLKVPLVVTADSNGDAPKDVDLHAAFTASQLHLGGNELVTLTIDTLSENDTYTCLTVTAPTHVLPMRLLPPECPAPDAGLSPVHVEPMGAPPTESQACYSVRSENDPALAVMLTQEERRVVVRHLLEAGLCLFGVCLLLSLAAGLTHSRLRSNHWKGLDLQNEPLINP